MGRTRKQRLGKEVRCKQLQSSHAMQQQHTQDRSLLRPPSRSVEDEDLLDYLENTMLADSDDPDQLHPEHMHAFARTSVNHAGIDVLLQGGLSSSSDDSDHSDSDHGDTSTDSDNDLAQRYPVQVAPSRIPDAAPSQGKAHKARRRVPGEKKRLRKEKILAKRAARGGLEVREVNERLRAMVVQDLDMEGFDASINAAHVVVRMASCYGLRAAVQGTGKRKTVVVQQTAHSALPHGGQVQLLQEIMATELQRQGAGTTPAPAVPKSSRKQASSHKAPTRSSSQPIAFVASGVLMEDGAVHTVHADATAQEDEAPSSLAAVERPAAPTPSSAPPILSPAAFLASQRRPSKSQHNTPPSDAAVVVGSSNAGRLLGLGLALGLGTDVFVAEPCSSSSPNPSSQQPPRPPASRQLEGQFGLFEQHTRGFGSRMLSKMGFVEGQGLGRHGDGIASPLESTQRAKRLGLGAVE